MTIILSSQPFYGQNVPRYPLNFQSRIPAALCALRNFMQEIDHDEGAIPTDSYQSPYTLFSPDIDDEHGFIAEDDNEANSEVKQCRANIANQMWESYLNYIADSGTGSSEDDHLSIVSIIDRSISCARNQILYMSDSE